MNPGRIDAAALAALLKGAAAGWRSHSEEIGQLDAAIADGDMGVTVDLASQALIDTPEEEDAGKFLMQCGLRINKASPSTFGTLFASAFMEAGKAVLGKNEIKRDELGAISRAAVDGIRKRGKAEVGEKTMLDALVPAVEALKGALDAGQDLPEVIEAVTRASEAGMLATDGMKAKYSRASYRPDGGIGIQDAGATAIYYFIEGLGRTSAKYFS